MLPNSPEYGDAMVAALELIWGEGFLSPGGPAEVAAALGGRDIRGAEVLDIGCGIGGIDLLLVERFGASKVLGIDVEADNIERARRRAEAKGSGGSRRLSPRRARPLALRDHPASTSSSPRIPSSISRTRRRSSPTSSGCCGRAGASWPATGCASMTSRRARPWRAISNRKGSPSPWPRRRAIAAPWPRPASAISRSATAMPGMPAGRARSWLPSLGRCAGA